MLIFAIVKGGKKVKTLKAVNMETIFRNFTKYAREKGFTTCVYSTESFGNSAWQNKNGETIILVPEN